MPANRVTIYLPDHVRAALGPCGEDSGVSLSGRVATIVLRYQEAVRRSRPRLSRAEWMLILDALNGVGRLAEERPEAAVAGLALEVYDHLRLNDAARKWSLTPAQATGLVDRLRALSYVEALSIVEAAEQFWTHHELETDAAIAAAGIVPSDPPPAKTRKR